MLDLELEAISIQLKWFDVPSEYLVISPFVITSICPFI